jgi:hypothetical protein
MPLFEGLIGVVVSKALGTMYHGWSDLSTGKTTRPDDVVITFKINGLSK